MVIQGSWCYTRESWAASILGREPAVPGKILGGMARGLIPGSSSSTLSRVPTVPGKIPGGIASRPTPAGQQPGVVSLIFYVYTRAGHRFVHTSGLGAMSVLTAGKRPSSDCDSVCVTVAVWAIVLKAANSPAGWSRLSPFQWAAWIGGLGRRLLAGRLLS